MFGVCVFFGREVREGGRRDWGEEEGKGAGEGGGGGGGGGGADVVLHIGVCSSKCTRATN